MGKKLNEGVMRIYTDTTGYSAITITRRLRELMQSGIVRSHGLNTSPNRRYSLNITND